MKRRPNNHRSKHKDKRTHEGYKFRKQRSLRDRKSSKYGVSTLIEDESTETADK